jgi:hypothetical protein
MMRVLIVFSGVVIVSLPRRSVPAMADARGLSITCCILSTVFCLLPLHDFIVPIFPSPILSK